MKKSIYYHLIKATRIYEFLVDMVLSFLYKNAMDSCGKSVKLHPKSSLYLGLENLSIGNHVSIPRFAHIFCTDAPLTIGNKVIFGPAPTIVTGNHRIDAVGRYIIDVYDKLSENDAPVIIEDDVWIGANVTILMGVTIGRGSVIAAGSIVNKSCQPYSIIGGVPAKCIKYRFTIDEILEHERLLYPTEKRYSINQLAYLKVN